MDECSEIQGESALQRYGKKIQFLGTWGLYVQQMFFCVVFSKKENFGVEKLPLVIIFLTDLS